MKPAPLTDEQILLAATSCADVHDEAAYLVAYTRAIEAAVNQQWQEMLAKQEPVAWSPSFDAWWTKNRVPTHKINGAEGFARKAFHAGFKTAVSSVGIEQPASIGQVVGSNPTRQASTTTPDHTAVMRQALEALQYFDDYVQPLTNKFGGPKVGEPASTSWHVHKAIAALKQALGEQP